MHDDDIENLRAFAAELRALTGLDDLSRIVGHVAGLRSWLTRGPQLTRENQILRDQLHSVAMHGIACPTVMGIPLVDQPRRPKTPTDN